MINSVTEDIYNSARGCLLGALVGDAAGATLEFMERDPNDKHVEWAMSMPGGGDMGVAPGQITDDGELTLCLAQALAENNSFSLEKIARNYAKWVESKPFDMGFTTSCSLGSYSHYQWQEIFDQQGYAAVMTQAAASLCRESKANGSLMRITPLAIWGYQLTDEELANYGQQDSCLSHSNPSCYYAVSCYVIAISNLIKNQQNRMAAFEAVKNWLNLQQNRIQNPVEYSGWAEVREWLQDAENNSIIPYFPQIGYVKIAFTHAFRHLLLGSDYIDAISETLRGGGDTDTNACIVGGLIGAACGVDAIPQDMQDKVINCDTTKGKHPRPAFLHPQQIDNLMLGLLRK